MKILDTWNNRKGRKLLDEKKRGFFVYADKGWLAIVEVYEQQRDSEHTQRRAGELYSRSHRISPKTLEVANRTKCVFRRISFELDGKMVIKLINAINEITALELKEYSPPEKAEEAVKSADDMKIEEFLEKNPGI